MTPNGHFCVKICLGIDMLMGLRVLAFGQSC